MSNISTKEHFVIIDNLYTFGMLLVLLGHIGLTPSFNNTYLHRWIYAFHMPLFFWIAGFLFDTKPRGIKFLKNKAKRLLIPLFTLTTLVFLPKVLLSQFALRPIKGGWTSYLESLLIPSYNPIMPLWFLVVLFGAYVLAEANTYVLSKYKWGGWMCLGLLYSVASYTIPNIDFLGVSRIIYFMPFFCLGIVCRKCKLIENNILSSKWIMLLSLGLLSIMAYHPINKYISAFVGIIFAISLINLLYKNNIPFFPQLRKYTFCIYLLQWFPMVFIRIVFFGHLHLNIWICYIIMFMTGLFIPILIGKLIYRIQNKKTILYRFMAYSCGLS